MIPWLLRLLGVTPDDPTKEKTGAREAAWTFVAICIALTLYISTLSVEKIVHFTPVLVILWPSATAALLAAYKIKSDSNKSARPEFSDHLGDPSSAENFTRDSMGFPP